MSCEKDEILVPTIEPDPTSEIQSQFSLSDYDVEYVKENLEVNWDQFSQSEINAGFYEFSTNLNSTLQNENGSLYFKYIVVAKLKENEKWDFHVVKFTAYESTSLANVILNNLGDFTGTIHHYDLTGTLKKIEGVEIGEVTSAYKGSPASHEKSTAKYHPPNWENPSDTGRWQMVRTEYFRDYFALTYNSSGQIINMRYTGSYRYNVRTEYIYVPANHPPPGMGDPAGYNNYHQHQYAPHGPAIPENPHSYERELEDEPARIINELEGKAKCVYDKMADNNGNINWILENFKDGDKPSEFDLKLRLDSTLSSTTNATTVKSGSSFIIKINANRIPYRTSLSIARTIIHEGIHARLREFASRDGSDETSFPGVYDYFRRFKKKLGSSANGRTL